jgi:hypothetical protein
MPIISHTSAVTAGGAFWGRAVILSPNFKGFPYEKSGVEEKPNGGVSWL